MVRVVGFSNKKLTDRSSTPKRLFFLATIGLFQYAFLLSVYLSSARPPLCSELERRIVLKSAPRLNSPLGHNGSCMNPTSEECSGCCKWCKDKCEQLSNECTPNTIYAHLIGGLANLRNCTENWFTPCIHRRTRFPSD